eukprot:TRINITY_DN18177_c0_g1_i1.p1 TRINITY_DN18177_c0_g1~~TRINITY_DN18177_c0_g1_i1.p1  ORF type:complete len:272 (-),score=29.74 TRINITY_DN18177_c0_g1_i1:27-731(-)
MAPPEDDERQVLVRAASATLSVVAPFAMLITSVAVTGDLRSSCLVTLVHLFLNFVPLLSTILCISSELNLVATRRGLLVWRSFKIVIILLPLCNFMVAAESDTSQVTLLLFLVLAVGELMFLVALYGLLMKQLEASASVQDGEAQTSVRYDVEKWSVQDGGVYGQETCIICLDNFEEDELVGKLPCSHVFHDHCFKAWYQLGNRNRSMCPLRCKHADQVAVEKIGQAHTETVHL